MECVDERTHGVVVVVVTACRVCWACICRRAVLRRNWMMKQRGLEMKAGGMHQPHHQVSTGSAPTT